MDGLIEATGALGTGYAAAPVSLAVAGWCAAGVIGVVTAIGLATAIRDWMQQVRAERRHTRLIGIGGHVWMPGRRGESGGRASGRAMASGDAHTRITTDTSGTGNGNG